MRTSTSSKLAVSDIGLGCMGMSEFYGAIDETAAEQTLEAAIALGVTLFDTADAYGFGHNERLVGKILARSPHRENLVLATKCGVVRDENQPTLRLINNDPAYILDACERSLERLGTCIDLYYLHRIANGGSQIEASMEAMFTLLQEGKIKHVGLSEPNTDQIRRAHSTLLDLTGGRQGLAAVQTEYSMMSRGPEQDGTLALCRELGILFVAYSPISRGLLTGSISSTDSMQDDDFRKALPRFQGDNMVCNLELVQTLTGFAQARDMTLAQLSLAWLLARAPHVVPIPGTKRTSYLTQNMATLKHVLSPDDLLELEDMLEAHPTQGLRYPAAAMQAYNLTS
ncbi:hypothetical protein VI06_20930 [Aquitalea magnusonii]|nr:hypothetical protein VI06_20930 [Aquitalea magnusonii]